VLFDGLGFVGGHIYLSLAPALGVQALELLVFQRVYHILQMMMLTTLNTLTSNSCIRYEYTYVESRTAFREVLQSLASGHRCHHGNHFLAGGLELWWVHTHAPFGVSVVLEPRGYRGFVMTAVTVVAIRTLRHPTNCALRCAKPSRACMITLRRQTGIRVGEYIKARLDVIRVPPEE
jgi:hypothetical protein